MGQDEVMKIMPVQKQSSAGQRTRFKAFVDIGDAAGHIGLGVKCSSEVATAIRGSVSVRLIPAPRGTGLVPSPAGKKLMTMAGITDCYTSSRGHTRTMGNFIKAMFYALRNTYGYLSPELWKDNPLLALPFQEHTDFLSKKMVQ